MTAIRLPSIDALADPEALSAVLGPVAGAQRVPVGTMTYSTNRH